MVIDGAGGDGMVRFDGNVEWVSLLVHLLVLVELEWGAPLAALLTHHRRLVHALLVGALLVMVESKVQGGSFPIYP